jgi:ribose 5-phosphate isomerase
VNYYDGSRDFTHLFLTGFQSKQLIVSSDLNLGDVDQFPTIDVTIDGADEYVQLP